MNCSIRGMTATLARSLWMAQATLLAAAVADAGAQEPSSAPAPAVTHPGVTLIHREIPGSDIVSVRVYLLGGPAAVGADVAGIEPLFLNVASRGTARYPGAASRSRLAALGGADYIQAEQDWTVYGVDGLARDFSALWDVFVDRLVAPELDSASLELERDRTLTLLRAARDDPQSVVGRLAARQAFAGHPYALPPQGNDTTLARVTPETLRAFQEGHVVASRLLVVVVGGVSLADVEPLVASTLGALPAGSYHWQPPEPWSADEERATVQDRDAPTNYIQGLFGGPRTMDEDYPAFQLAVGTLSGLVGGRIRSEGLSYAAGALVLDYAASGGGIYLSTPDPERSLEIIEEGIDLMQEVIFRRSDIRQNARNSILAYYAQNETPDRQADFLARSYLRRGEPQSLEDFIQELYDIDPAAVRGAARKYFQNIQWAYLGDPEAVPDTEVWKR